MAFHITKSRTILKPNSARRLISGSIILNSVFNSCDVIPLLRRGDIGRYGGSLLREAKFTPRKRTNLPCVSRNHMPSLTKSRALIYSIVICYHYLLRYKAGRYIPCSLFIFSTYNINIESKIVTFTSFLAVCVEIIKESQFIVVL